MASLNFNKGIEAWARGAIDFDSDTFKCMLVTSSYSPDKDAHDFRNDVTNEVSGTGYSTGGTTVTATISVDTANDRVEVTYSNPSWASASFTARGAVIYKSRGGASSADEILHYVDFGSDIVVSGGTFALTFSSTFRIQN